MAQVKSHVIHVQNAIIFGENAFLGLQNRVLAVFLQTEYPWKNMFIAMLLIIICKSVTMFCGSVQSTVL